MGEGKMRNGVQAAGKSNEHVKMDADLR